MERTVSLSPPIAFSEKAVCMRVLLEAEEAKELEYWRKRTLQEEKSKKKEHLGKGEEGEEKEEIEIEIEIEENEEEYIKLNPNTSIHIVNSLESFEHQCR